MANSTTNLDTISSSQASKEVTANALYDAGSPATLYGRRATTTTALTWGFYGGYVSISGTPTAIANGTVALTGSTTNYVVAARATGVVSTSTATTNWNSSAYIRLYEIVTGVSSVTSYADHRTLLIAEIALASGGALGTPSSGTLTNCTGLPAAGLVTSTTQAVGFGSIELGHASDTTLTRSAAGVMAVEGVVVDTVSATNTLTNKRITARRGSTTSHATPTINTDSYDIYSLTAQAEAITSFTTNLTGTPVHGDALLIEVTGTAARAITWGASFEASTIALPTTTVTTVMLQVSFLWNSTTSKWRCIGVA